MTTEAKLKKLEEDQIIMEDQNCKLAKVGPAVPCSYGCSRAGPDRPTCLFTRSAMAPSSGKHFSQGTQGLWTPAPLVNEKAGPEASCFSLVSVFPSL